MDKLLFYVTQMFVDRGCVIDDNNKLKLHFENGPYPYLNRDNNIKIYSEGIKVYIARYFMEENLEVRSFDLSRSYLKQILNETLKQIVSGIPPKTDIIIIIPDVFFNKISVENKLTDLISLFCESSFKFNPTKNKLTPKHVRASQEDIQLLRSKKIENRHLPIILENDPICRWYGFHKGEIIKIYRSYSESIYYRTVSN